MRIDELSRDHATTAIDLDDRILASEGSQAIACGGDRGSVRDRPKTRKPAAVSATRHGLSDFRRTIFHESWWLDAVAPGRWRQVTLERGGRTVGALPYIAERDGPFASLTAPGLCHVLGPTLVVDGSKLESRQRSAQSLVSALLEQLPPAAHTIFRLDAGVTDALPYLLHDFRISVQYTFLIDTNRSESEIWVELRDKTRNLVRRAQERLEVVELDDAEQFVQAYRTNLGDRASYVDLSAAVRAFVEAKSRGQSTILAAVDREGKVGAAAMFVWDSEACYYLLSTRDPSSGDLGAASLVLWRGILLAKERGVVLDCDGVANPAMLQFYLGFGGKVASRHVVCRASMAYRAFNIVRMARDRLAGVPFYIARYSGFPD